MQNCNILRQAKEREECKTKINNELVLKIKIYDGTKRIPLYIDNATSAKNN